MKDNYNCVVSINFSGTTNFQKQKEAFNTANKRNWFSFLTVFIALFSFVFTQAQTVLISPTGDGGFENGSTFAANGWSVANSTNNPWIVAPLSNGAITGNAAFISSDGTTPSYSTSGTCSNFFWRDVTIPAGETKIKLDFNWISNGESTTWDIWQVFVAPTSVTPLAGAHPGFGLSNVPAGIAGATWVGSGSLQTTVQSTTLYLPTSSAGNTVRLIFHWKSDTSAGSQPPAQIDNISLVSSVPGNFISIATGDWGNPTTWDANSVPSPVDSATITAGHVVTVNAVGQSINNLTVNGTLNYATTPTTFNVNGDLTVDSSGTVNVFNGTTGKTLFVSKNLLNNGIVNISVGATTAGNLTLNGTQVQSVSGTGVFSNGFIRNLTFANTNLSTPNIVWSFNNIAIANNLNMSGARINLGANKMIFGNQAAGGTLTAPIGTGFLPGGKFSRWWTATVTGTAFTAGTDPSNTTSRYPFMNTNGTDRSMYISRTNSTGAVAGELAVVYTDATSVTTGLSIADGTYTVTNRFDGNWSVFNEGTAVSASSYRVALLAPNTLYPSNGNSRVIGATAAISGTHQNGTITPGAQRLDITQADLLAGPLHIGVAAEDIPFVSIASGDFNAVTTWNKGTLPTCTDIVTIAVGHTVTSNSVANVAQSITISSGATLVMASGDLTIGCTNNNNTFINNGTLTVSGGTMTVNGSFTHNAGSTFNHSAGDIIVDGNSGVAATSVAGTASLVQLSSQFVNWTGGKLTIVDPHAATGSAITYTNSIVNVNVTSGHTLQFGDGVSGTAGGSATNGFRINTWASSGRITFNNVIVNNLEGPTGTNRFVSSTYSFGINGDFTIEAEGEYRQTTLLYLAKNLTNRGKLLSTTTLFFANFLNGVESASPNEQIVSGLGAFDNNATTVTGNFVNVTVNNSNANGVTLSRTFSITGTLNLVSGFVNTTETNILTVGTAASAGTISGGNASAYVKGPLKRFFANANNAFQIFPVGAASYKPLWLNPATTAVGSSIKATAFDTNTGTANPGITALSATTRWEAPIVDGSGSITTVNARIGLPSLIATNIIVQSPTATGEYNSVFGPLTTNFTSGAIPTLEGQTALPSADYTGFLSFATLNACEGLPTPGDTVASSTLICNGQSVNLVIQNIPTTTGNSYQWESSLNGVDYVNIANATSFSLTVTPTTATFYRCVVTCVNGGLSANSTPVQLTFANNVVSTTDGTRCGEGSATLGATTATGTLKWYAAATGGIALGTGPSFITPSIAATTTYFVGSETFAPGISTLGAGAVTSTSVAATFFPGGWGGAKTQYIIKASELLAAGIGAGNITSLGFEPTSSGQEYQGFFVNIGNTTSQVATSAFATTGLSQVYAGTGTDNGFQPVANTVNTLNFGTGAGSVSSFNWDGTSNIVVSISWSRIPGAFTATGSGMKVDNVGFVSTVYHQADNITPDAMLAIATSTAFTPTSSNRPRFHINGQSVCSSPRVAVVATVTPPPALTLQSNTTTICNGTTSAAITITAGASDYNSFVWSPSTGVTGDAANGWVFNPTVTTTYNLVAGQTSPNLVSNGDFSNGLTGWSSFVANWIPVTANFTAANNEANITGITGAGGQTWFVQLNQIFTPAQIASLEVGSSYKITFSARSSVNNRSLKLFFGQEGGGFVPLHEQNYSLSNTNANYETSVFTVGQVFGAMKLGFEMGLMNDDAFIDNITLTKVISACAISSSVLVTVIPSPTPLVIAAAVDICVNNTQALTVTGGTLDNVVILQENFNAATNGWQRANNSTGGTPSNVAWELRTSAYAVSGPWNSNDGSQFYLSDSDSGGSGSVTNVSLTSPSFSTLNYTSANVSFWHFYQHIFAGTAKVQYSIDNGTTWADIQTYSANVGTKTAFVNANLALPAEAINQANVKLRFQFNANWGWFWAIDNVTVSGTQITASIWSPSTNLFTDAAATVPYNGTGASTVYHKSNVGVGPTTYTVTATGANGCFSTTSTIVTVFATPTPTGLPIFTFCPTAGSTLADIAVTGTDIKFYATATSTTPLASTNALSSGYYYATQTLNNCESQARFAVFVIGIATPAPVVAPLQSFCLNATVADLTASGENLIWYASPSGGVALAASTALVQGTYFVSQTTNGCESPRAAVAVNFNNVTAPLVSATAASCSGSGVATITNFNTSATYVFVPAGPIVNGGVISGMTFGETYTVTSVSNGCESNVSNTFSVSEILPTPAAPTGEAVQVPLEGSTIAALIVVGQNIVWYATLADALAGTNPLSPSVVLQDETFYYATQTINGCTSAPFEVYVDLTLSSGGFDMTSLKYYPNPVVSNFNISYSETITQVTVMNILGQSVLKQSNGTNAVSIDMSALPAGTYMVQIESDDMSTLVKVVKR